MLFAFFMASPMTGAGIQSGLITILRQVHGLAIEAASSVLTGYMAGTIGVVVSGAIMPAPYVSARVAEDRTSG
jgi:hypothetical protein